jgi:hypothetical protein
MVNLQIWGTFAQNLIPREAPSKLTFPLLSTISNHCPFDFGTASAFPRNYSQTDLAHLFFLANSVIFDRFIEFSLIKSIC